jgi:predicted AAA+ superfamily ATPase
MLSREVHTSLRGRGMETVIRPFSFREFLRHRAEEPERKVGVFTSAERSRVEKLFGEYLTVGGFPEAQGLDAGLRVDLLQGYVDTVLFRDVVERHGVTQVAALRWLTRQCLKNPAGSFSVHRLHQDLKAQGLGVNKDALHSMVGHLEDAFLVRSMPLATESERRRNSNPRKVYPVDTGLIGAFDRTGRSNIGHALETAVLHELDRRHAEVGYVRTATGYEVDFLARFHDGPEELIQVCANVGAAESRQRECRALEEAAREHPRAARRLLVLNADQMSVKVPEDVRVQPAYQWLLDAE